MKLKELKEIINKIDDKYNEADILVDTEAALFSVHMVDITNITLEDNEYSENTHGKPFIDIQLDDNAKMY